MGFTGTGSGGVAETKIGSEGTVEPETDSEDEAELEMGFEGSEKRRPFSGWAQDAQWLSHLGQALEAG